MKRAQSPIVFLLSPLLFLLFLSSACHFNRSNPNDIAGTDYVGVSILRPGENAQIATDTVVASWQGQGDIAAFNYRLDNGEWTSVGTQTSAVLRHLEEGAHFLEVRATNTKDKDSTAAVDFTVNALAGPSICVAPQVTVCKSSDTAVTVAIDLEEVYQVMGVNALLCFDHRKIAYTRSSSAWTFFADTLGPDTLELSAACLDSVNGFSGSGRLASLTFKPVSVASAADIVFITGRSRLTVIGGGTSPFRSLRKGSITQ